VPSCSTSCSRSHCSTVPQNSHGSLPSTAPPKLAILHRIHPSTMALIIGEPCSCGFDVLWLISPMSSNLVVQGKYAVSCTVERCWGNRERSITHKIIDSRVQLTFAHEELDRIPTSSARVRNSALHPIHPLDIPFLADNICSAYHLPRRKIRRWDRTLTEHHHCYCSRPASRRKRRGFRPRRHWQLQSPLSCGAGQRDANRRLGQPEQMSSLRSNRCASHCAPVISQLCRGHLDVVI
jgi:hypothetical protein